MDKTTRLISGIFNREVRAIARAITEAENRTPEASVILKNVFPHTGHALILGITGAPGSGKSTLVDRLIEIYRKQGQLVAVLAIDPTSPFTGGAILGDRIRMQAHSLDPGTYIRSMATRGHLGGLSPATVDAAYILDAARFDVIIIETVGVGQDEVDIAKTADVTLVVLVPGMGDDIQTMKAGIMEIGDLFVINKADREGVLRMEQELHALLTLTTRSDGWEPKIIKTIALQNSGLAELYENINAYTAFLERSGQRKRRHAETMNQRLIDLLQEKLLAGVLNKTLQDGDLKRYVEQIIARERDPYSVVDEILKRIGL
jgi:LAO/AO transport system kinase